MSDLVEQLTRLGLSQYLEAFVGEGFDTWETVLDITESDLSSLSVKLGHRRKLQRAIAESRGQTTDRPLPIVLRHTASVDGSYRSGDESPPESKTKQGETSTAGATTSTKRKYRRHPKPDEHAPERPPSAYVIFSNQVRETLKGQELSFTEVAKVVGERWQILPADARKACERQANSAKEKYYTSLAEYKKTPQYDAYQKYLDEFKAKHAPPKGKRARTEPEARPSTRSSSYDQLERTPGRRISLVQADSLPSQRRSEPNPPPGPVRLPSGPSHPSKPSSPATQSWSGYNSPRTSSHYSPHSGSPRSATLQKESSFEMQPSAMSKNAQGLSDPNFVNPPLAHTSHYQSPVGLPSRRSDRDMTRLPALSHEDTTLSSDSSQTGQFPSYSTTPSLLPVLDAPKNRRTLPAPVPSATMGPSPLDRAPLVKTSPPPHQPVHHAPHNQQDYRETSSLAALLRASELARVADDVDMAD